MSPRAVDWLEVGRDILAPGVQLPLPPTRILCGVCGEDVSRCPVCEGTGAVVEHDELAYRRQGQPALDPPAAFDYPVRCQHCRGLGHHVCAPHQCDVCGKTALVYDAESGLHFCLGHRP